MKSSKMFVILKEIGEIFVKNVEFFAKYLNKLWAVLGTARSYDIEPRTVEKLLKRAIFWF